MNTIQTALGTYKVNYCPSSNTNVPAKAVPTKEISMGTKKLSLAEKDQILTQYNNGLNGVEIATVTGLKYSQVNYYLAKVKKRRGGAKREVAVIQKQLEKATNGSDISRNRKPPTQEQIDKMKELKAANPTMAYKTIGDTVGVSGNTVRRYLAATDYRKKNARGPHKNTLEVVERAATPTNKSPLLTALKERIKEEIRDEIRAELIQEILGK